MKLKFALLLLLSFVSLNAQKKWSLQECINHAQKNNISIQQQELSKNLAKEDILSARGNFYPSLNASASQNFNFGSYIDNYGGRVSRDSRGNSFNLSSGVLLFNGKKNQYLLQQAKKNLELANLITSESKNNIMLLVVNEYLNVLLNKESLKIAEDQVNITKKQVEKSKKLIEAGVKPKATLLEAEATLANNKQQVVVAKNNLELSLLSLAQLIQAPYKNFNVEEVNITINTATLTYKNTDKIFEKALSILPEIKGATASIEMAKLNLKMAKTGYLPNLSLNGGIGTSYQHNIGSKDVRLIIDPKTNKTVAVPNGFGKQLENNLGYNVGLSLSIPIFNRFQNKIAVNKAKINNQKAELQLAEKKIKLKEAIEKAYANAKAALNQYLSAEKSLQSQEESFKNAQNSFDAGVLTSFDFEQIRGRLVNAKSSMINAKYNYVFRTKLLEYYLGIPIEIK